MTGWSPYRRVCSRSRESPSGCSASSARISLCRRGSGSRPPSRRASAAAEESQAQSCGPGARQRVLHQAGQQPGRGQPDRVGPVPGGREVDDAEDPSGPRFADRCRPADPAVHDRGVVLGAEDRRRGGAACGQRQRVGAHAPLVPPPAGHEVDALGAATHHPAPVGPQDPGAGVGDGQHEVAVLGGTAQVALDPAHRDAERGAAPQVTGLLLVGERSGLQVRRHADGAAPAAPDLRSHARAPGATARDEGGPGPECRLAALRQGGAGHAGTLAPLCARSHPWNGGGGHSGCGGGRRRRGRRGSAPAPR